MKLVSEKILVVDDDYAFRKAVASLLESKGYRVIDSSGRLDLMRLMLREDPDLILLDLRMTEVDGEEIIETMRRKKMNIPVIVISGSLNQLYRRILKNRGVADFIMKPFQTNTLLAKVEKLFSTRAFK